MDAGPDADPWESPGILCGADADGADIYCAASTSFCCGRRHSEGTRFECVTGNPFGQCIGGAAIQCDDRSDCAGSQICCGQFDQVLGYRSVQCQATCGPSPLPGVTSVRFCDPNAPADECADIGLTCTTSGSLDGFHICK